MVNLTGTIKVSFNKSSLTSSASFESKFRFGRFVHLNLLQLLLIMLQDTHTIRYYQKLTDDMVDLWHRGCHMDEIRYYVDGYLACLRHSQVIEPYLIHRLEESVFQFLRDPSNFELLLPQTKPDYY